MLSTYNTQGRDLAWLHECMAMERAETGFAFNSFADSFHRAPELVYAQLRQHSPVHFSRLLDCWVLTRHQEVDQVLRDHDTFGSDPRSATQKLIDPYGMLDPERPSLFMVDPPDHTRLRGVVTNAFSRTAIERSRPLLAERIREVVESLGRPGDQVDLVTRFARVIPLRVLDVLTGLDTRDAAELAGWVPAVVRALEPIASTRTAGEALDSYRKLSGYLDQQRALPAAKGTICWSLREAVRSSTLTDAESRQLLIFLVLAGTATVGDFLANAAQWLSGLPAQAAARQQVDATLIDELLMRSSPVQIVARTALAPAVLAGCRIRPGERLLLVLASANRDSPAAMPASGGHPRRDVTFGCGIHRCLGTYLARVEARLALSRLLRTFPGIRLIGAARSRRCVTLRSWNSVIVRL